MTDAPKRGRPRLSAERGENFTLRLPPALRAELERIAVRDRSTVGRVLIQAAEEFVSGTPPGTPRKRAKAAK